MWWYLCTRACFVVLGGMAPEERLMTRAAHSGVGAIASAFHTQTRAIKDRAKPFDRLERCRPVRKGMRRADARILRLPLVAPALPP